MNFSSILRLMADWQDFVAGDASARERLITQVQVEIQQMAANDHDALGALLDRAAESARASRFFRPT